MDNREPTRCKVRSSDSKSFAINYLANGNNVVQAFSVVSLKSIWTASNSLASDLVFTPDGKFIVELKTHVPLFYWRNIEQGNIVHMGEFKDTEHITNRSCSGGGQVMIENAKGNFAVMADYNAARSVSTGRVWFSSVSWI